ncbi:MAG: SRPBCC domain-containing protein [Maribacter sp.]|nr:SRPBCC domain-containing protein [Maribacter sp.]
MKSTDPLVVVEHSFNTSMQKVWSAITDLDEMRQWYFDQLEDFRPKVGFRTQFVVQVEDRVFTHLWEVTQVIPQRKITYNWKYLEYPGSGDVSFELLPGQDHVIVRLDVRVIDDFPDDIPEFKRESWVQGWEYFIGQNLKEYLHS